MEEDSQSSFSVSRQGFETGTSLTEMRSLISVVGGHGLNLSGLFCEHSNKPLGRREILGHAEQQSVSYVEICFMELIITTAVRRRYDALKFSYILA
jgi:hypothetical protein